MAPIQQKVNALEHIVGKLAAEFGEWQEESVADLFRTVKRLRSTVMLKNQRIDELKQKVEKLENRITALKGHNTRLKNQIDKVLKTPIQ